MRPPAFWPNPPKAPGLAARAAGAAGLALCRCHRAPGGVSGRATAPAVPVICIGNLNVGGTGKTPTAIALDRASAIARPSGRRGQSRLWRQLARPAAGRSKPNTSAAQVGDEPLLLSAFAPTFIGRDRAAAVRLAEASGAAGDPAGRRLSEPRAWSKTCPSSWSMPPHGFGNGRCLPAGPLREPVAAGLDRADLILAIGDDAAQAQFATPTGPVCAKPVVPGTLNPLQMGMDWQGAPRHRLCRHRQPRQILCHPARRRGGGPARSGAGRSPTPVPTP